MNDKLSSSPTRPDRRRWIYAGGAAAAALGGAAFGWWQLRPHEAGAPGAEGDMPEVWVQTFTTPGGESLPMAQFRGKPLVLNFWATWCPPCVEELPLLNRFHAEQKARGWQVLGLAIDQPSNVLKFLARMPLDFPVGLAGMGGTELGRALGNLQGGLPFTVLFGANGSVLQRKMGQLSADDLAQWVRQY